MTQTRTFDLARYHLYLTRVGAGLAVVCALSVFLYGTFLLLAVEHAAARTAAQDNIGALAAEVGDLETQYLAAARALTPDSAASLGYVAPREVSTIYAGSSYHTLSLRTNN